jgi:hypothetical protein
MKNAFDGNHVILAMLKTDWHSFTGAPGLLLAMPFAAMFS